MTGRIFLLKSRTVFFSFFFLLAISHRSVAQDDLLKELQKESMPSHEKVLAAFKGNKIINAQTNETLQKKCLDFRVNHQFGNIGRESGGGVHTLYGLDQSNDIRIALHYGITDRLTVGVGRCKRDENLEGLLKFRLLQQTTNHSVPLAITVFGNATVTTESGEFVDQFKHRLTYCAQAIISRKFSSKFSFEIIPSFLHRNLVSADDENDLYSIGGGARWKFTRSTSIIADYFYSINRKGLFETHTDPLGIGFEIETGGHVFTVMFTNASGILENDFLANTVDDWKKGGIKFSFIISRIFNFGKSDKQPTAKSS
ncbi:MAG: DUF5777 family beta-barrel protein [Bacteroidetes bacterium]|nr:DUF5777 family beta-barrel protein [Bacteroidota bacterium]